MRHFYKSIAVPKILYATDLFLIPETGRSKGMKGFIARLAKDTEAGKPPHHWCIEVSPHRCNRCLCGYPALPPTH